MKKNMQGFTLIELMIVVAIVAILAAIALPAYQDYLKRSKVSEIVAAAGACKTSVAEYYAARNAMPGTAAAAGCSTTDTQYAQNLAVGAGGIITIEATADTGTTGNIVLTPTIVSNEITAWVCTGSIPNKHKPASCRA